MGMGQQLAGGHAMGQPQPAMGLGGASGAAAPGYPQAQPSGQHAALQAALRAGGMAGGGMAGGGMPVQHVVDPNEVRICFTFLNRGQCNREGSCRFRHLAPDHPDAIADRVKTGRMPSQTAPGASAGAPTQDMLPMGMVLGGGMMPGAAGF